MSEDGGGKATSAVAGGTRGTSLVGVVARDGFPTAPCVVNTSAGDWMTPIVGGVSDVGERSSLALEKPYATRAAATTTPTVEAMRTTRDRRFDSIVSTTTTTLSR
jgi:hypothetical protein